jgi:glyoxylase-like metal-dependent hydrolase (beta-lactamase superfamily II)
MKQVLPGIWQWSWFSEEKRLDFNGLFLTVGEHKIIVDPPPMAADVGTHIRRHGPLDYIIITNRDHLRETASVQSEFKCQLFLPESDASQMDLKATRTFRDGELLPGGIWVIQLADQKSPGECALYLQLGRGVLIVGDALIGKPSGMLQRLPSDKYRDPLKAKDGLRRLLKYNFDSILVGDGESILAGAKQAVEKALED